MSIAISMGQSERVAVYEVPDNEMSIGSTLGGPKAVCIIKANGALKTVYSSDMGENLFGTVILRHDDNQTGMHLAQQGAGTFTVHPGVYSRNGKNRALSFHSTQGVARMQETNGKNKQPDYPEKNAVWRSRHVFLLLGNGLQRQITGQRQQ